MERLCDRPRAAGWAPVSVFAVVMALLSPAHATVQEANETPLGPDWSLKPAYGSATLSSGFVPDPLQIVVASGGPINAAQAIGQNCSGFIARAPNYRLHYEAGASSLYISVWARADTTLVIRGPDGTWHCNDDGGVTLDPLVWWKSPASGQYDIWIGTFSSPDRFPADLFISEIGGAQPGPNGPQVGQPAADNVSDEVTIVGTYQDWYVMELAGICVAATRADATDQMGPTEVYAYQLEGVNRVSFVFANSLSQSSFVTVSIDGEQQFQLAPVDRIATTDERIDQDEFATRMRTGVQMSVASVTRSGVEQVDTISLLGYTAAIDHTARGCS